VWKIRKSCHSCKRRAQCINELLFSWDPLGLQLLSVVFWPNLIHNTTCDLKLIIGLRWRCCCLSNNRSNWYSKQRLWKCRWLHFLWQSHSCANWSNK
jgi:hypothetical protein